MNASVGGCAVVQRLLERRHRVARLYRRGGGKVQADAGCERAGGRVRAAATGCEEGCVSRACGCAGVRVLG